MNLDDLRQRFRERCKTDLEKLSSVPDPSVGLESPEQKGLLIEVSHRISGSGGIFGFGDLSDAANALESLLIEPSVDLTEVGRAYGDLIATLEEVTAAET